MRKPPAAGRETIVLVTPATRPPAGLFIGLATLDVIQAVESMPASNQKVVALDFEVAAGGPATNAAVAFASLGGGAQVLTALPAHPLAAFMAAELAAVGVKLTPAATYAGPPVTASILVTRSNGDRAIVSPTSAGVHGNPAPAAEAPSLDGIGVVLIDGYFRAIAMPVVAAARRAGIPVIFDGGSFKPHTPEVIGAATVAVLSEDFSPPLSGDARPDPAAVIDWCMGHGVSHVAITRGERPVVYATPTVTGEVEVPRVRAVDTLGAGDFFHGALAHRIATGGLDDARFPADLAVAANVAARSVQHFGTRAWLRA